MSDTSLITVWDSHLLDLIQFGFPLDFNREFALQSAFENHASALKYEEHVDVYIQEELQHNALYGPFDNPPFPLHISPLMTREKQNSDTRHTIMDLSWPKEAPVNDVIHKCKYLDTYFHLQYPSIDTILQQIKELGPGALVYKVDSAGPFSTFAMIREM